MLFIANGTRIRKQDGRTDGRIAASLNATLPWVKGEVIPYSFDRERTLYRYATRGIINSTEISGT